MRKESTTNFLRRGFISTFALVVALLASCSSDSDLINNSEAANGSSADDVLHSGESGLIAEAHSKEFEDIVTRSSLNYNPTAKAMQFAWDENDKLTVFAEDNYQAKQIYNIIPKDNYDNRAHFSSRDFKLTVGKRYFALSKAEDDHPGGPNTNIPDQRNIVVDFSGQKQIGNGSAAHLGNYDFQATSAVCEEEDQLYFDFQHLGATLRMQIRPAEVKDGSTADNVTNFNATKFTSIEIYSSDNSFRQPLRNFDLSKGVQGDGSFTPALEEPDLTGNPDRFTINLYTDDVDHPGIQPYPASNFNDGTDASRNGDYNLIVYMEVPPAVLSGKSVGLILHGLDEHDAPITYYATRNGFNIVAGKSYNVPFVAKQTTDYTVTLKVDHLWKYGYTQSVTRAGTGDPGYDKENVLPMYVYLFFCTGGNVVKVQDYTTSGNEGTGENDWTRDENISIYNKTTTLATAGYTEAQKNSLRVYAIASPFAITHGIDEGDTESKVKALAYNYSSQDNMRDLYSTPWESNETFVGNLKDPMQDIFVYHVAAKVDLKWNSTTKLTDNVSVNNFQSANLSMFMPTTNGTGSFVSDTKQTVQTSITPGTCWNGRQVYYLPQFANNKYNVTIGTGHDYSPFTFTGTTTTGGFTSWLRGLITQ